MSQDGTSSVLIIGAGPTGMTAALELARFGIEVRIIEKTPEPATTSRAVGVQARTLELLEQRGLAAQAECHSRADMPPPSGSAALAGSCAKVECSGVPRCLRRSTLCRSSG